MNALSPSTMPYVDLGKALGKVGAVLLGEVDNKVQVHLTTQGKHAGLEKMVRR